MDLDFVEKLIGIVSRSPIAELEVERDGMRVRICKHAAASALRPETPARSTAPAVFADAAPASSAPAWHSIRAPLTGVFYRAASEGAPPLVSVGDTVEEGQKIGILEAMKTFNVVEADRAGRIVEIPVDNAASVQSGDVLFVLEEAVGD
ncbi:MAG: acetyl-CoA carboxylase biotin carboxyl carrier protein subunit [Rhizobiales bacterium]|nr:acetyl-CoA carboxylase biotin carboxyl carrier protein subunit [Hyphomicrobiales bacterium]